MKRTTMERLPSTDLPSTMVQKMRYTVCAALIAVLFSLLAAHAQEEAVRHFTELGVPSTGLNRLLGQPIWRFPNLERFVPMFGEAITQIGFSTAGAFDSDVGDRRGNAQPLTADTPGDTRLASYLDALGLSFVGVTPDMVPTEVLNIPIDDVDVLVDEFGVVRSSIACTSSVSDPTAIVRSAPCDAPITLATWLEAQGVAHTQCFADGSAEVSITMDGLRPNRMYSIWYIVENIDAGPQFFLHPLPFGGVPNIIVANRHGEAAYERQLQFCPHDQERALGVVVVMRSNGQNYGGVPVPFLNQEDATTAFAGYRGLIPGTVAHVQLSFNINGERIEAMQMP